MAVDPNIAMAYRGVEVPNQLAQYAQLAQIQGAQTQNQLHQLQMREAEALAQERNALRQLNPANADYETQLFKVNPQLGIQYRKERSAAEANQAQTQMHQANAAKARSEFMAQGERDLSRNPSDANITAWAEDTVASNLFNQEEKAAVQRRAEMLLSMPIADRASAMQSRGAKPSDLRPHMVTESLGGTSRISAVPAFGGLPTVVSEAKKTATPGEIMTDARARERLTAEMATGVLTPQSLDVAANVYLQTGQLPTGLGKSAANLRSQVMNRATELSTGKPAADVAGGIVEAKQDVASRGKAVKDFSTGIQGRQVNAFNTAIDHLGTMDKLTDALNNGDIKAINSIGNVIARQTGAPAPTNFDAAKQIVTAEVIKAVVASGGGVTERQEAERNFAAANSPEQLKGIINTYKQLLGGQLKSLNLQYENTTGRKDFDKKLTGEAKNVVQQLSSGEQKQAPVLQGQDKQALDWANANPTDPRAAAIKQRLGL